MTTNTHPTQRLPRLFFAGLLGALLVAIPAQSQDATAPMNPAPTRAAKGQTQADASMKKATAFLLSQQHQNGGFGQIPDSDVKGEVGITGLTLRALAKLPEAHKTKQVREGIDRAAGYLLAFQQRDGSFSEPATGLKTYRTALTITALNAIDKVKYADAIRRGHEYLTSSQFSEDNGLEELGSDSPYYGGWGYGKAGVKADSDMSNTQFTIEALKETGLEVDPKVWARAAVFLQRCQANTETNDVPTERVKIRNDGGFMYDPALDEGKSVPIERPDGKIEIPSYASMTYAGLMSFLYADIDRKDSRVQAAWNWIGEHYTLSENYGLGTRANPRAAKQGLYYYYHAFSKALNAWGQAEIETKDGLRHWGLDLVEHLGALQKPEGFWTNDEPRWWEGDPVLATSYSLLALDLAYPWIHETGTETREVPQKTGSKGEAPDNK